MERKLKSGSPQNWELENGREESFGAFIQRMRKLNDWSQEDLLREPYLKGKTDEWLKKGCLELLNLEVQNSIREKFVDFVLRVIMKDKKNYSEEDKKKMIEDLLLDVLRLKSKEPQKKILISLVAACKNELQDTQYPEGTSKKNKKGLSKSRLSSIERDVRIEKKRSKEEELIRPKKDTLEFLAEVLEIPMVVMEAKLNGEPIPWKEILIEQHYSAEQLMQAREVIEDALMVLEKMKEAKEEKTP